jgi:hypothetical protein
VGHEEGSFALAYSLSRQQVEGGRMWLREKRLHPVLLPMAGSYAKKIALAGLVRTFPITAFIRHWPART